MLEQIKYKYYEANIYGRDFVCGDIHGCFSLLEKKLSLIGFDKNIDRLFTVGDLTDYGPESELATEYLDKSWFYSVLGDHENAIINCFKNKSITPIWIYKNGGKWIFKKGRKWIDNYVEKINTLPYVIQIAKTGIIHSRIPTNYSWQNLIDNMYDPEIIKYLLKKRTGSPKMKDIDVVYAGHTIVYDIRYYGSIKNIDTGAYRSDYDNYYGDLTICEI